MTNGYDTTKLIGAASKARRDRNSGESLWTRSLTLRAGMLRGLTPRKCNLIIARLMAVVRRGEDKDAIQAAKVLLDHIAGKPPTATGMADRINASRSNGQSAITQQIVLQLFPEDPAGVKRRGRKPVYRAGSDRLRLRMPEVVPGMAEVIATQQSEAAGLLEASGQDGLGDAVGEAQEAQGEA